MGQICFRDGCCPARKPHKCPYFKGFRRFTLHCPGYAVGTPRLLETFSYFGLLLAFPLGFTSVLDLFERMFFGCSGPFCGFHPSQADSVFVSYRWYYNSERQIVQLFSAGVRPQIFGTINKEVCSTFLACSCLLIFKPLWPRQLQAF